MSFEMERILAVLRRYIGERLNPYLKAVLLPIMRVAIVIIF
jgi:hypothetical protein